MQKVKITVIRKAEYKDLMERYENPIEHACDLYVGQVFVSCDAKDRTVFATVHGAVFFRLY